MRICFPALAFGLLLSINSAGIAEVPPPSGEPPHFWRASAEDVGGEVVLRLSRPTYVTPRKAVYPELMKWKTLRPAKLGTSSRVLRANGELMTPAEVLEALDEPRGVVVFMEFSEHDRFKPHPFYLQMVREGTCVVVVDAAAILDLRP